MYLLRFRLLSSALAQLNSNFKVRVTRRKSSIKHNNQELEEELIGVILQLIKFYSETMRFRTGFTGFEPVPLIQYTSHVVSALDVFAFFSVEARLLSLVVVSSSALGRTKTVYNRSLYILLRTVFPK